MTPLRLRPAGPTDLDLLRRRDDQPHVLESDPHDDRGWEQDAWAHAGVARATHGPAVPDRRVQVDGAEEGVEALQLSIETAGSTR